MISSFTGAHLAPSLVLWLFYFVLFSPAYSDSVDEPELHLLSGKKMVMSLGKNKTRDVSPHLTSPPLFVFLSQDE